MSLFSVDKQSDDHFSIGEIVARLFEQGQILGFESPATGRITIKDKRGGKANIVYTWPLVKSRNLE